MEKILFTINPHSFIDVITNSSTELFICDIDKSVKTVREMLESYPGLHGYEYPWIFKVDEFIKAKKENFKQKYIGFELDERYRTLDGWFYVPDEEVFKKEARITRILYGNNNYSDKSRYESRFDGLAWNEKHAEALKIYDEIQEDDEKPDWWDSPYTSSYLVDARDYDNQIIIMGSGDNDIPCEYFEILERHFNATRIHMG